MKNKINFSKMHGLGNDFVIIEDFNTILTPQNLSIPSIANRHLGIGFDQLLILSSSEKADFFCRIYNADGSEAEQCGNGLRCLARYIHERGLHKADFFHIETIAGISKLTIENYDAISLDLGKPIVDDLQYHITVAGKPIEASILSLGNPHAIIKVDSVNHADVSFLGKNFEQIFTASNGINVGFMQIIAADHIKLRTYERGVGETFSCGSNACAAVAAGNLKGWLQPFVKVELKHGFLQIECHDDNVKLCGPAAHVFDGCFST